MLHPARLAFPLIVALLAAGCGRKEPAPGAAPQKGKETASTTPSANAPMIWRVGNGTEPQDLDPQVVTGVPEHKLIMAIFEGLLAENPRDLSPEPGVAERWEVSADGLT